MTCRPRVLVFACTLGLMTCAAHAASKTFLANDYGAKGDGSTLDTVSIQTTIDAAAKSGGTVTFKPGNYLTGSLFLKSGTTMDVGEGVTLIGSQKLGDYPMLPTRIAGIETRCGPNFVRPGSLQTNQQATSSKSQLIR